MRHASIVPPFPFMRRGPAPRLPVELCRWPEGRPFALFLSHDADSVYGSDFSGGVADENTPRHPGAPDKNGSPRRVCSGRKRAPRQPKSDAGVFESLLALERRHGFHSTFFMGPPKNGIWQGRLSSFQFAAIQAVARLILEAKCELGVQGGDDCVNSPGRYRALVEAVETHFGVRPHGIRNHRLRFSYPETWRTQAEAGFAYDATYGLPGELGPRGGWPFPFQTCDATNKNLLDLYALPLTVMDQTLFHHLHFGGERALAQAWAAVRGVAEVGGLVSLFWHNRSFAEAEDGDARGVYSELLARLAPLNPWCATGMEINSWWRAKSAVTLRSLPVGRKTVLYQLHAPQAIDRLAINFGPAEILKHPAAALLERFGQGNGNRITFPRLLAGETITVEVGVE